MKRGAQFLLWFMLLDCWQNALLAHTGHGAILFMNYCNGCHSLNYVSWTRMVDDLQLTAQNTVQIRPDFKLSLPNRTPTWPQIALAPTDAQQWFGKSPPDLSLTSTQRGSQWIRDYLQGFYPDPSQRFGVNNHQLPQSKMPHILEQLQQEITPTEFAHILDDITDFLNYAAEPSQQDRTRLGYFVVGFLIILSGIFWLRFRF